MKQNNSALYSVLSFLLIAVLMLSVVGVIMRYTNGGTTDFALFYVAHDGQSIMTDTTITLSDGETATFAPKYAADDIMHSIGQGTEKKGYNVKIVPNITKETSFTYQVGDNKHRFEKLADTDFSSAFNLKKEEKVFSIKVDEFTVQNLLSTQYENKTVIMPENFDNKKPYFNIVVSSFDEKNVIVISLQDSGLISFTLDGTEYSAKRGTTLKDLSDLDNYPIQIKKILPRGQFFVVSNGFEYPVYANLTDGEIITEYSSLSSVKGQKYYAVTHLNSVTISSERIPPIVFKLPLFMSWAEFVNSDFNLKDSAYRFYLSNENVYYTTSYLGSMYTFKLLWRGDHAVRYDDEIDPDCTYNGSSYSLVEVS